MKKTGYFPIRAMAPALRIAARLTGVHAVIPMAFADVPAGDFIDDYHLSPDGAALYTRKLVQTLTPWMSTFGSAKGGADLAP
jgi:hypothetical protein